MNEQDIRQRVRDIRTFYINLLIYGVVSVACIIVWLLSGKGAFWPIWVIIGCSFAAVLQAFHLGMTPILPEWFPFLNPEWEDQKVEALLKEQETSKSKHKKTTKEK